MIEASTTLNVRIKSILIFVQIKKLDDHVLKYSLKLSQDHWYTCDFHSNINRLHERHHFSSQQRKNQDQTNQTIVRLTTQKLTKVVIFCPRPICMFTEHFFSIRFTVTSAEFDLIESNYKSKLKIKH